MDTEIVYRADVLSQQIAWESGELDEVSEVDLFQRLIDSGAVWQLPGSYGRQAAALIEAGYCHRPRGRRANK